MALKLVTAPPGTGKTLLLIKMIFDYLREGRRVYSNIDQLQIAEVLPIGHNADWRDLPDGSVVIYDEAQEHAAFSSDDLIDFPEYIESEQYENETTTAYNARLRKEKKEYDKAYDKHCESIKDIARGFQVHRHFGFDIILATQDQSFLNGLAKKCVGEHYHLTRPFGLRGNMIFFWRRLVTSPDSRSEKSVCEWKKHINFNKTYFSLYRSANVHTHKSHIPFKYIFVGLVVIALIFLTYYLLAGNKAVKLYSNQKDENKPLSTDIVVNTEMPTTPEAKAAFEQQQKLQQEREQKLQEQREIYAKNLEKQQEREISGCVYFHGKYTAVDEYARPIHDKDHLCKQVIQDADRNVMKTPTRQTYQNTYSKQAEEQLQAAQQAEAQRQVFNEP
ncbi:zonular occludens toxin domain-containing protein [Acinetobacter calcoaceticus]|uniref:zonular occludens toxin domain-containing protein n=1 Tax=Acinetobacter calcoaceticus TaxID=471 RepID=UPI00125053DD|nr:zonular occludens toxin domain-containing protein [Acinetobacter calcoaceticus]